jgi:hypothetical protein
MELNRDMLLDSRLIDRNVERGLISKEEAAAHIEGLEDLTEKAAPFVAKLAKVNMRTVVAKDTGEHE